MARLKTIIIAAPKGSLGESTSEKFSEIGIPYDLKRKNSSFEHRWKGYKIIIKRMRAHSIPRAVISGSAHLGVTGKDCVLEDNLRRADCESMEQSDVVVLRELNYNKSSRGCVRVVAVKRKKARGKKFKSFSHSNLDILSEFPYITRKYYPNAVIEPTIGGAEDELANTDYYDLAVCVTESGSSIMENGLEIVKTLFKSTTVLIANEEKKELVEFADMLEGTIKAPDYMEIKMHVPRERIQEVTSLLPSLKEPNSIWLPQKKLFSVETIVKVSEIFHLRHVLKPLEVTGFVGKKIDLFIP